MAAIRDVDLAWEAITISFDLLGRALDLVKQRGGESPSVKSRDVIAGNAIVGLIIVICGTTLVVSSE